MPQPGVGDRAAVAHERDEVHALASRANKVVTVTYESVALQELHREVPVPRDQLTAEARQAVQEVLAAAGEPE